MAGWDYTTPRDAATFAAINANAEAGDAHAQNELGHLYYHGCGVDTDKQKALHFLRLAANQNHAQAETTIGYMHREGDGVKRSFVESVEWFKKADAHGGAQAEFYMWGVFQNLTKYFGKNLYDFENIAQDRGFEDMMGAIRSVTFHYSNKIENPSPSDRKKLAGDNVRDQALAEAALENIYLREEMSENGIRKTFCQAAEGLVKAVEKKEPAAKSQMQKLWRDVTSYVGSNADDLGNFGIVRPQMEDALGAIRIMSFHYTKEAEKLKLEPAGA